MEGEFSVSLHLNRTEQMVDKIVGTFLSRIIAALVSLVIVIINANTFGAEGTGTIALVILGLTILQLFSNFIGGGSLVYLIPRNKLSQIILLTYSWSFFINITGTLLLSLLNLIPEGFELLLCLLSLTNSFFFINITIMQGKENIKLFNLYQLSQIFILLFSFAILLLLGHYLDWVIKEEFYVYALIISYLIPLLASFRFLSKNMDELNFKGMWTLLKEMFRLGFWVQLSNFAQLMNYRLNYYFIQFYAGNKPLGLFELGTKLSEVTLIFPKSIALVQYSRIANCNDTEYARRLTVALLKIVFAFSFTVVVFLSLIPAKGLAFVFGPEFYEAKKVIYCLAPGIVFLSCLSIISHYFSGFANYWVNSISSFIGLIVTLCLGLFLIPRSMEQGYLCVIQAAGIVTSLSYFASFLFSFILFSSKTSLKWKELLISKSDIQLLKTELRSLYQKTFKKN